MLTTSIKSDFHEIVWTSPVIQHVIFDYFNHMHVHAVLIVFPASGHERNYFKFPFVAVDVVLPLVIFFLCSPFFSLLPPSRNLDLGSRSSLFPLPSTVRALHSYPENISALHSSICVELCHGILCT